MHALNLIYFLNNFAYFMHGVIIGLCCNILLFN